MRATDDLLVRVRSALMADDRGANLVEYSILLVFIVVLSIAAITLIGEETSSKFVPVGQTL